MSVIVSTWLHHSVPRLNIISDYVYEGVSDEASIWISDSVKQGAFRSVYGHHAICWGPE